MKLIRLVAIEEWHIGMLTTWRNNENVLPYCRQYRPPSDADTEKWYLSSYKDKEYNLVNDLFIIEHGKDAIGVGGFVRIDWRNRKAELSFYIGEDNHRTEGTILRSLKLLVDYAFKTLNLHKIYFPCYSFNPYLPIYEKILEKEYIACQEYFYEGKYFDRIILVKYNEKLAKTRL